MSFSASKSRPIPYGRHSVDETDIKAVMEVLQSDWLTTGPKVNEFENTLASLSGTKEAVAVCNGTAALHAAMYAIGIGLGDEVIVPPLTFAATANAVVFQQGTPVFADVDRDTLLLDPDRVQEKITSRTKAIIAVDFAGQPCDYDSLLQIADRHGLVLVADACHSLGGSYKGRPVGSLADLNVFSFHPVKHITTGEGGMVTTQVEDFAEKMRRFRNHGINADYHQREQRVSWFYEMVDLGYNYRITDFQCALGLSQLKKLPKWIARRRAIAREYDQAFADISGITPLELRPEVIHAYHLYVLRVEKGRAKVERGDFFRALRREGIGVNVHYIPVHLHPFYMERFGTGPGLCPIAEQAYEEIISLPMFPGLTKEQINFIVNTIYKVLGSHWPNAIYAE